MDPATPTYRKAAGEQVYLTVLAPDRRQATVTARYMLGFLRSRPELERLILHETRERVALHGDLVLEVISATKTAPRGRSYGFALIEESSFLPSDDVSSDPDLEVTRALRPALACVPGSLLCVVGSPYRQRGLLYDAIVEGSRPDRVVVTGSTLSLNPAFDRREVERAWQHDPTGAASEYGEMDGPGIPFRSDVSGLLTLEALAAVVPDGIRELKPGPAACGHFDAATGSGSDSAALAVAFRGTPTQLAYIRRWSPPFSPSRVIAEAAQVLRTYGVREVEIDRFAPGLVSDLFHEHGIRATVADHDTSAAFIALLAAVNSQRVRLLDVAPLLSELRQLERRPGTGRDHVSHPPRGHDDCAAACAGALLAATAPRSAITGLVW